MVCEYTTLFALKVAMLFTRTTTYMIAVTGRREAQYASPSNAYGTDICVIQLVEVRRFPRPLK